MSNINPSGTGNKKVTIDMTPLVDVAFLLLTFFMLTAQFRQTTSTPLSLPDAKSGQIMNSKNQIILSMNDTSLVYFNATYFVKKDSLAVLNLFSQLPEAIDIVKAIQLILPSDSLIPFILKLDKNVSYERFDELLTILKKEKVKTVFISTEGKQ